MYIYYYQTLTPARRPKGYLKLGQTTLYWQALILHILFTDYLNTESIFNISTQTNMIAQSSSRTEIYLYLELPQKGPHFQLSTHSVLTIY